MPPDSEPLNKFSNQLQISHLLEHPLGGLPVTGDTCFGFGWTFPEENTTGVLGNVCDRITGNHPLSDGCNLVLDDLWCALLNEQAIPKRRHINARYLFGQRRDIGRH